MSIIINDNLAVNVGKPVDSKYLNITTPWASVGAAEAGIPITYRYLGLTVNVAGVEYWWRDSTADGSLIEKKYDSMIPTGDFVTGATNLGFFSGLTGVQTIQTALGFPALYLNKFFISKYNYYYLDSPTEIIRIGTPEPNDVSRRAYVTIAKDYSWIYNYDSGTWVIVPGDVSENVGTALGVAYYSVFTETSWIGGTSPISGGTGVNVVGSLTTGTTLTIGVPPFAYFEHNNLHFRTIINQTPEFLKINYDENFINFSGTSSVINGQNLGTGRQVFKIKTGTTLNFRTLVPSGDTTITQNGDNLIIFSSSDGSANALTGATNYGNGISVYTGTTSRNLGFRTIIGSGDTSVTTSGNTIIVHTLGSGDACYNLASPSAICVGGILQNTILTGKTAFQLFEELLVPELCGTVTEPSVTSVGLSASGLYEIDCNLSQTVTINFSRGSINPQYCSATPYRSAGANAYCFCGTGMPSGFQACTALSASQTNASYDVLIGTQSWGGCTRHDAGNAALSNKNNQYCAALGSGYTNVGSNTIIGVYPIWATCTIIGSLSKISPLYDMNTSSYVQITLVTESGGNKQKFEIPCAWIGAPTNNPLTGVRTWVGVASAWCYLNGGTAACSLTEWNASSANETVQGNSVGYCQYTFNGIDRATTCIRLEF